MKSFRKNKRRGSLKKQKTMISGSILPRNDIFFDYTKDEDVKRSFEYYNKLDQETKQLFIDYRAEVEDDDWEDHPLKVNYLVSNWMIRNWAANKENRKKSIQQPPELLNVITKQQYREQIESSLKLSNVLENFPKIKENKQIMLYRGGGEGSFTDTLKRKLRKKGDDLTMYSFVSTSLNKAVAEKFAVKYILYINLSRGTPLPFISDKLTLNYNLDIQTISNEPSSESEVLLPFGCTFKLISKGTQMVRGSEVDVYYLQLVKFGKKETRHFNKEFTKKSMDLFKYTKAVLKRKTRDESNLHSQATEKTSNSSQQTREESPIEISMRTPTKTPQELFFSQVLPEEQQKLSSITSKKSSKQRSTRKTKKRRKTNL